MRDKSRLLPGSRALPLFVTSVAVDALLPLSEPWWKDMKARWVSGDLGVRPCRGALPL